MKYFTYFGNHLINAKIPDNSDVFFAKPPIPGIKRTALREKTQQAFENPLEMPPLRELVDGNSKVLILFDDNCQPFPATKKPDLRQIMIETLLKLLYEYEVEKKNIELMCAVALHRKMKKHELEYMLGKDIMDEFYPHQLRNFDAEDAEQIVEVGKTEEDEVVETDKAALDADLIIYVDMIQIPLNGGHKSVAVGLGTYNSIAPHHSPHMTSECPHVMQPEGSHMHACIERMSRLIQKETPIFVLEAAMNGAIYPFHLRYVGKPNKDCNIVEKVIKAFTPATLSILPESARYKILKSVQTDYEPMDVNAGDIDAVHAKTLELMKDQLAIDIPRQYSTLVFGLPDMSPYAVDARINPVLVVSDILGYVFNWFYNKPIIKENGVVIIMNPTYEIFHEEYHVAYKMFYDEVLEDTTEPFEMQQKYQKKYAKDEYLIDCYRNKYAHHGFHPFTVWYWATYPLKYLSKVILVGPKEPRVAHRLGVEWAKNLDDALAMAREISGEDDVVALTMPPFFYANVGM